MELTAEEQTRFDDALLRVVTTTGYALIAEARSAVLDKNPGHWDGHRKSLAGRDRILVQYTVSTPNASLNGDLKSLVRLGGSPAIPDLTVLDQSWGKGPDMGKEFYFDDRFKLDIDVGDGTKKTFTHLFQRVPVGDGHISDLR